MKNKKTFPAKTYILLSVLIALLMVAAIYSSSKAQGYPSVLQMIEANFVGLDVSDNGEDHFSQVQVKADDVDLLIKNWEDNKFRYETWIHMVSNVKTEQVSGIVLPDGQSMPLDYIQDDWIYFDKEGLVQTGVFISKDLEGYILQQAVYKNNTMINNFFT